MKGWPERLAELGHHVATELEWDQVWAIIARELRLRSVSAAGAQLWRLRFASWIVSLDADPRTCRYCGGAIDETLSIRATYCTTACRKAAFRARQANEPSPFEIEVSRAQRTLVELRQHAAMGQRALRRWMKTGIPIEPPDWTTLDHVPMLPPPCEGGCGDGPCTRTQGSCLYSRSTRPVHDATEED